MKIKKFELHFCNPEKVFIAGDKIEGHVVLYIKQPITVNGLRLYIGGRGNCRPFSGLCQQSHKRTNYSAEVHYLSINLDLVVSGHHLREGEHSIPYSATLPASIPSSFEGCQGYIRYYCQVTLSCSGESDIKESRNFTLIHHVDLNQIPDARSPIVAEQTEYIQGLWCMSGGDYKARFQIDKTGYVPGELLQLTLDVNNNSPLRSKWITCLLRQTTTYKGYQNGRISNNIQTDVKTHNFELFEKRILVRNKLHLIESCEIPSLPPSKLIGCDIIDVKYNLVLTIRIYSQVLEIIRNIIIGTIPLRPLSPTAPHEENLQNIAPPSYEECVLGHIKGKRTEHSEWKPSYPYYRDQGQAEAVCQQTVFPPGDNWV